MLSLLSTSTVAPLPTLDSEAKKQLTYKALDHLQKSSGYKSVKNLLNSIKVTSGIFGAMTFVSGFCLKTLPKISILRNEGSWPSFSANGDALIKETFESSHLNTAYWLIVTACLAHVGKQFISSKEQEHAKLAQAYAKIADAQKATLLNEIINDATLK